MLYNSFCVLLGVGVKPRFTDKLERTQKDTRGNSIMALTKEEKTKVIKDNQRAEKDTGSVEVQIAILTEQIKKLTVHMTNNKHDYSSKRGMDIKIARRKNLLSYLKRIDAERYTALIKKLGLSK